MMLFVNYCFFR